MLTSESRASQIAGPNAHSSLTQRAIQDAIGAMLPYPLATVAVAKERLMSSDFDFVGGHYRQDITQDEVIIGVPFTARGRSIAAR
jgi:hypothetical protein